MWSSRGQQYNISSLQQTEASERCCRPGKGELLTVFRRKDFLICDQFLTKTHYKVNILRSSALRLLPPLIIPVVYSKKTKKEHVSVHAETHKKYKHFRQITEEHDIITQLSNAAEINHAECFPKNACGLWSRKRDNTQVTYETQLRHHVCLHLGKTHTLNDISLADWQGSQWRCGSVTLQTIIYCVSYWRILLQISGLRVFLLRWHCWAPGVSSQSRAGQTFPEGWPR